MKFLFDLFPIILFFITYKIANSHLPEALSIASSFLGPDIDGKQAPILLATTVAIVATFMQIGWLLIRRRKVDGMLWLSLAIIVLFGGATLIFHDETFIKWKPTVLYWLFASVLLGGKLFFRKNLIKSLMEKQKISTSEPIWNTLNLSWIAFFSTMGAINLYFAYNFSTETWVDFKMWGALGLMFVFVFLQGMWLAKHIEHTD
jgi:intracellular septation protein